MTFNMITAQEALAQGSTPSMFFSIARFTESEAIRRTARERGRELALLLGMDIGGRKRGANDNRRKPKKRRAA